MILAHLWVMRSAWDTETPPPDGGHAPRGAPSPRAARSLRRTHRPRLPGVRFLINLALEPAHIGIDALCVLG